MTEDFVVPSQVEILSVLRKHKLIKLKEDVKAAYLVGSFCTGKNHPDSDVDILLEVTNRHGLSTQELEDKYRQALRQHFVTHKIEGKCDSVHPQWTGRRVDLYFTYDASLESRPKTILAKLPLKLSTSPKAKP